ncbi:MULTISPECIES: tRNA (adenosine(37)-N6)-threonylcarbamoyltransferase complex ATPase subunit type 1 TsaE [Staphylococcus]|jgi:tRNA threonylcarbamoyladenosine biosynthesis protein TsaE|uniref:tRNA threonylcarbamoyladenosine biosynthesis protein TsaE n=1 Tax=Staphylococcus nepalensis TaxID=214473 RepID=A0A291JJR3_9STAP|nr:MULTISPECIES: tRNA (adenosine(37)-N6)-threonylcarbamoyltransferase complex ATPase subunit type 1 TsaE [Staphylococcus]VDG66611.1 ATPase [Lacrimispora indolis]ATH59658.1 tRNA (adenosine(37)-N6)-threonylcarbamoyltransferase complex ATPase subunit type 1 TsaE [Staphylococcus nepalensis]ATH64749.1 tRNA (adenosine(37)-N6)-threonylcarbamoyltransferase complex ATPase subunit type 1 TsaE [Staphylococcus nepalensis]AWI44098.1 tRNA (adenosine(37)-N6)-threonylcarbamoyltransferase complex ATPase subunit
MIKIKGLENMEQFGEILTKHLSAGDIILLNGDLGAGKTTLSQFIGKALGVKRNINSPTFNIIKSYQGETLKLHHMDCYRLEDSEEDLGFDEYFEDKAITLIEWSQFITEFLPPEHLIINIKTVSPTERDIEIKAVGQHYLKIKEAVEHEMLVD